MEKWSLAVLVSVIVAGVGIAAATSLWLQEGGARSTFPRIPSGCRPVSVSMSMLLTYPGARSMTPGPEGILVRVIPGLGESGISHNIQTFSSFSAVEECLKM